MATVDSVVSFLVQRVGEQLIRYVNLLRQERDQLIWVQREFRRMECFLRDADARLEENERVRNWRQEVKEAACDAEDIIDTFFLEIAPLRQPGFVGTLWRGVFFYKEFMACRRLASEIERLKVDLQSISESRTSYAILEDMGKGDASDTQISLGDQGPIFATQSSSSMNQAEGTTGSTTQTPIGDQKATEITSHGEETGAASQSQGQSQSQSRGDQKLSPPAPAAADTHQEADFVGFGNEMKHLIRLLTNVEQQRRCVIGIVGMGGLGKTTLARKIYESDDVKRHFHYFVWISISQVFAVTKLLQTLIRSCMVLTEKEEREVETMSPMELTAKISKHLAQKKYLIVLDDMWKVEAWEALKNALPDMGNGSRVLLTTRKKDVASNADPRSTPYELRRLNGDESWELFQKKAILGENASSNPQLVDLGKEMVKKCAGLPLAIVIIGGLLARKEPSEWKNVSKSIRWQLGEEVKMSEILSLSYRDLPYYLKPCLLYLGIFPEDYEFRAEKLIKMWAAEGFLDQRGEETMEEVGEDNLKELIRRSLVQVSARSSTGAIKTCRIHDLLQDLLIAEAKKERFLEVEREDLNAGASSFAPCRSRRLAIHRSGRYNSFDDFTPNLRSILIYSHNSEKWLERSEEKLILGGFQLLRVLDLNNMRMENLAGEIGELIHLRYLGCAVTKLRSLPSSIGNLINLQTLVVESDDDVEIPSTIKKMKQLRHLRIRGRSWGVINGQPLLHQVSRSLCSLANVRAGEWLHSDSLREMINLRKLGIRLLSSRRQNSGERGWKLIVGLKSLESLFVSSENPRDTRESLRLEPLDQLERLRKLRLLGTMESLPRSSYFPPSLVKLSLTFSQLRQDPLQTLKKLENLRFLKLGKLSYIGSEMSCSKGDFPQLQTLYLDTLLNLKEWKVEEGSMPSLSYLQISQCKQLESIPKGLQRMTTLKLELCNMGWKFHERVGIREGDDDWSRIRRVVSIQIQE
ncbi:hypothetical protein ACLOJK_039942 [Asimina triloba]